MIRDCEPFLTEKIKQGQSILLTGLPCVGKSTLALTIAKNSGFRYLSCNVHLDSWLREELSMNSLTEVIETMLVSQNGPCIIILDEFSDLGKERVISLLLGPIPNHVLFISNHPEWFLTSQITELSAKLQVHTVLPYSFTEFLRASEHTWYQEVLKAHVSARKEIPQLILDEINECFYDYLLVGGYPGCVAAYQTNRGDMDAIYHAQKNVFLSIGAEFFDEDILPKTVSSLRLHQLIKLIAKTNGASDIMNYSTIRKGATKKQFEAELDYLERIGLIYSVFRDEQTIRYEFSDSAFYRYLNNDYEIFLELEEHPCPKHILQQYVYSTIWRQGCTVNTWRSQRGAGVSFLHPSGKWALDCVDSTKDYGRNRDSLLHEKPDCRIYTCGITNSSNRILYAALPQLLSNIPLDENTLLV